MSAHVDANGDRRCTGCGTSVEDLPYEFWLFHTCRSCAHDAAQLPERWDHYTGTARKWRYRPRWHFQVDAEGGR